MNKIRAHIEEDPRSDPFLATIRLHVIDGRDPMRGYFLVEDGTWTSVNEGETAPRSGIVLPRESVLAIAEAIDRWTHGGTDHATEARVLREWLGVERARVDRMLKP